ncbi:hypothetical protein [Streptomyces sp. NBC_01481]|uniref:hypothetical protein n=1 Tax=Streptomyces sp. NBC_01481 TaxID=2975869 RepID=UPI00225A41B6|nr:hypothetical protein [Streptomyces sp. NBC_01481]MCX4586193.1 hypothetical protein [Streptomyces sp. NBC_01481]
MDDMQILREIGADVQAPGHARLTPVRQRLLDEIAQPRRRRGGWRLAVVSAAAAVVAAGLLTVVPTPNAGPQDAVKPPPPPINYAAITTPRDTEWIYRKVAVYKAPLNFVNDLNPITIKDRTTGKEYTGNYARSDYYEEWRRFGGNEARRLEADGYERAADGGWGAPKEMRSKVAKLPDDPASLLTALRDVIPIEDDLQESTNNANYRRIVETFSSVDLIPARVRTSLFRALGTIPGVLIDNKPVKDAAGRTALAVYEPDSKHTASLNLRVELLLDPKTHQYLGERTLYLAGGKIDGKIGTEDTVVDSSAMVKLAVTGAFPERP